VLEPWDRKFENLSKRACVSNLHFYALPVEDVKKKNRGFKP